MAEPRLNSILAADFGSANTRALLIELVDGEYRLVAQAVGRSTAASASDDAYACLSAILQKVGEASGRRFFDDGGFLIRPEESDRVGVDYFLTTTSAGAPLRAVLVGLYPQLSLAAARRAIAPFYIDAVAEIHLEDGLGAKGRLNRIIHSQPQLIFFTGGTDGGARRALLEMLALTREAVSLMPQGSRPAVIYAGNSSVAASAREMLSQGAEVLIAPNIRPGGGALEQAQSVLAAYFDGVTRLRKSVRRMATMSDSGLAPTARGVEKMTAYFARALGFDVLTIDCGSARTMLSLARNGTQQTVIRNDIGLGHSASTALELIGEDKVARWLPFHPRKGELAEYSLKKGMRAASVPLDMRHRYIEYALLRAAICHMKPELHSFDRARLGLVLLAGATFTGSGQGALDMLLLADALDLEGVVQVKSDPYGALPALGTLASVAPTAVVQLIDGNALVHVGLLVRVSGQAAAGTTAVKVKARGGKGELIEREVVAGDVWHLPAPAGSAVDLRLQTRRGLTIGGKRRLRIQAQGGRGGVLIDARLDAQAGAKTMTERAVNMLRWYAAVTGQEGPVAIPESWLSV
jgi:hypothetical protein